MVPLIIGAGGHAQDIAAITGWPTLEHHSDAGEPGLMIVGINDPHVRADVAAVLEKRGWCAVLPVIHPTAYVGGPTSSGHPYQLSAGVVVGPLASLLTDVKLGRHVHVGAGSHLTRCTIGAFTTVAPGVTVCGDVVIGERCLIGAGATIKNLVVIGSDVTVGAGAVVVDDIPNGATVKGVPAR